MLALLTGENMACCAPVYRPPTFNLVCNIWRNANPTSNPPDDIQACNLSPGKLVGISPPNLLDSAVPIGGMWLKLPRGVVICDGANALGMDVIEVPRASGRFYTANWTDISAMGFPNEHVFVYMQKMTPFPGTGGGPPPPPPPPPGGTLIYLDQATTPMMAQVGINLNVTTTVAGYLVARVVQFVNQPMQASLDGAAPIPPEASSTDTVTASMITAELSSFKWAVPVAGVHNIAISNGGVAAQYMVQVFFYPSAFALNEWSNAGHSTVSAPALGGGSATHAPNFALATFGIIGDVPIEAWQAPFALHGTDCNYAITAVNCLMTTGFYDQPALGLVTPTLAGGGRSGWVGTSIGYMH